MPFGFDDSPNFGFAQGKQPSVTEPYMPTPEQVAQAEAEQNKPGLFWRALQVPNRLLGGQMVTGFLEGTGRGGIGEGLLQGFLNNPLFQLSDGLFGTHITKDVNFADVRKAFGDNDAEGGIANFAINTVGDILTSPLELMWSPFAKIVKATEGASAFAKGAKNFGGAVFKDMVENTPAGLAASVANEASPVRRALMSFKIPFSDKGFAFKAPANLDLYTAKTIDGMVGWLNSNPATSAVLNLFTRARLAVADPQQRAIADAARSSAEAVRREAQVWLPQLKNVVDKAVKNNLKLDANELATITLLHDIGVSATDDAAAIMQAIKDGPQVALAKRRTRDLLAGAERRGPGGVRDMVYESQRKIARDLEIELKSGDPARVEAAFNRWMQELPDAQIPESFRSSALGAQYESKLRPGVDIAPHEYKPIDVILADVEGRQVVSSKGIVSPGAQNTSAANRAADILAGEPLPSQVMHQKYQATAKDLIQGILDDKGIDHVQKLAAVGEALRDLSRRMGLGEQAAGVLNTTIEQYLPRSLTPEMRKLLGTEITKATAGRVNLESTMMEMNLWAANYGSRLTNYKAVTLNGDEGTMSVMELLSKILPEDLAKKLKGAGQAGDAAANEAFQFMSTNPFYTMHRRIEAHLNLMEKAAFHKAIDESPLILEKSKIHEVARNMDLQQKYVGVVVNKTKMSTPGKALNHGEMVDEMMQASNKARLLQSRQQMMDYFSDEVERIERQMRARGEEPTVATVEQAIKEHRQALLDTKANDWDPNVEVPNKKPVTEEMKNTKMGQHMTRYVELTEAADPLKEKGKVYFDPIVDAVNPETQGIVPKQKVTLEPGDVPEPATAQVHTKTTTITDNPARRVKPIKVTPEYAQAALDRYRTSYFKEEQALQRKLDEAHASVQFWGEKLSTIDEGVNVHVPVEQQLPGDVRNATRRVTNSAAEEAATLTAEQQVKKSLLKYQNLRAEQRAAQNDLRSATTATKKADIRGVKARQQMSALQEESANLSYRMVEDPKMLDKQLKRIDDLEYRIRRAETKASRAESTSARARARGEEAQRVAEGLGPAVELSQAELAQAREALAAAKKAYAAAAEPLDNIRKMVEQNWKAAAGDKASYFRQIMERRMGREALKLPEQIGENPNPFVEAAVAEQWAFDMAGRKAEVARLQTLIENERQAVKETTSRFLEIAKDITGSLKAAPGERVKLVKKILEYDPHGSEMIDELHILLRQEKNGTLPLQELKDVFNRRAEILNSKLTPSSPKVNGEDLLQKWMSKHADTEIHWYDPTVHEGLYGKRGMWNQMFEPTSLARTWPVFDKFTSWWKATTVLPPWFIKARLRDVLSTQITAMQGTGTVAGYASHMDAFKSGKAIAAALEGDFTAADKILVNAGKDGMIPVSEVVRIGQRTGGLNSGFVRDELGVMGAGIAGVTGQASQEAGFVSKFLNPSTAGWAKRGAKNMELFDNHMKVATALEYAKHKGTTLEEAFNAVKPWIYDPARADLSNAERYIFKKLIPFYSYQKFAIQTQLKAAFQKPATMTWWEKVHTNANKMMGMTELEMQSFLPEFIQTNMGIPTEKRPDGVYVKMFGNFLPFAELHRLVTTIQQTFDPQSSSGIKDFLGGNLNPAIRIPVEWFTNRSFYTQHPIEQFEGQQGEMFGIPMSMQMKNGLSSMRMLNELDQLNVFNFGDVTKLMSLGDAVERKQYAKSSFLEKLQASSLGINPLGKPYFLSSEMQSRVAMGKAEQEISALKHQMKVQVEKGNPSTQGANLQKLQELMAEKMARLNAIDTASKKLGLTKDKRGDYHAPVQ